MIKRGLPVGTITEEQIDDAAFLIREIKKEVESKYGINFEITREKIVRHSEITPKRKPNCPGLEERFITEIIRRAREL